MAERDHPYDGIADSLFEWMQGEVEYYVEALRGGYRSPFTAPVSEKEKMDYYRRQMFQTDPDGTIHYDRPNAGGRDSLLKQFGPRTYASIWEAVRPKQGLRPPVEEQPDMLEETMPPMPEDESSLMGPE